METVGIVHTSVLLHECMDFLRPENDTRSVLVDSTLGEGGHSFAFLSAFPAVNIIGVDADSEIQSVAKKRLSEFGERVRFYNGWFDDFFSNYPAEFEKPDLILFDLGISMFHYEKSGRGFSFRHEEPLDMRVSPSAQMSAYNIVNEMGESDIADLIYKYGEEKLSRKIAKAIAEARVGGRITSSRELADIIYDAVPDYYRHGAIHPATRTFQALRIAANGELRRLSRGLSAAFDVLKVGGKMGVITFHSLEDRIVKNFFREWGKSCVCPPNIAKCECGGKPCAEVLTRKPVLPTRDECEKNPPSRSAKLRVIKKMRDESDVHSAVLRKFAEL